jgi:hypothetical protein
MNIITQRELYWKHMIDRLILFKDTYGHVNVPLRYDDDPALGQWVVNQRILWKKYMIDRSKTISQLDDLTTAKLRALDKVGFCYDIPNHNWYTMFDRLVKYKEQRRRQYLALVSQHVQQIIQKDYEKEEKKRQKNIRYIQNLLLSYQQQLLLLRYQNTLGLADEEAVRIQQEDQRISKTIQSLQQQMDHLKVVYVVPHLSDQEIHSQIEENFDFYFYVPTQDLLHQDLRLWIQTQRQEYSRRKKRQEIQQDTFLERLTALESIGFTWNSSRRKRMIQVGDIHIDWVSTTDPLNAKDMRIPQIRIQASKKPIHGKKIFNEIVSQSPTKEEFTDPKSTVRQKDKWFRGIDESKEFSSISESNEYERDNHRELLVNQQFSLRRWSDDSWSEDDLLALWDEEDELGN